MSVVRIHACCKTSASQVSTAAHLSRTGGISAQVLVMSRLVSLIVSRMVLLRVRVELAVAGLGHACIAHAAAHYALAHAEGASAHTSTTHGAAHCALSTERALAHTIGALHSLSVVRIHACCKIGTSQVSTAAHLSRTGGISAQVLVMSRLVSLIVSRMVLLRVRVELAVAGLGHDCIAHAAAHYALAHAEGASAHTGITHSAAISVLTQAASVNALSDASAKRALTHPVGALYALSVVRIHASRKAGTAKVRAASHLSRTGGISAQVLIMSRLVSLIVSRMVLLDVRIVLTVAGLGHTCIAHAAAD